MVNKIIMNSSSYINMHQFNGKARKELMSFIEFLKFRFSFYLNGVN